MTASPPTRRPLLAPDAAAQRIGDEVVVVTPADGRMHTLNEVGGFVLERADGVRSLAALTAAVVAAFEVDEATARADVEAFVTEAISLGILVWAPPQGGPGSNPKTG